MLMVSPARASFLPRPPDRFVLLVDDHEPTLVGLRRLVESAGHPCVATVCTKEAQGYCLGRRPSVVVTDLSMPHMDGHALGMWVKSRYPKVPLLLVTGEVLDCKRIEHLRDTFVAVMSKPIPIEPFLTLLNQLMPALGA